MELIIYEQPLNELIRVSLRLEHVFHQIDHNRIIYHADHTRGLVKLLVELINLLDRPDLKFKLSQEFNRLLHHFDRLQYLPDISRRTLDEFREKLKIFTEGFLNTRGKFVESLRSNELLNSIRQGLLSAGGDSHIDLPHYFYWLNQSIALQREQIQTWFYEFDAIRSSIELLLEIIRNASEPIQYQAERGFYHQILDAQLPLQLIRVGLRADSGIYPEISASRHRVNIRFLQANLQDRPKQTEETISFELNCCAI